MARPWTGALVGLGLAVPTAAHADPPVPRLVAELAPPSQARDQGAESTGPDPWTSRKRQISAQAGVPGGPLGYGGLSFEYAPIKYLVLGTGGGWSPSGPTGAFWPRLRLPLTRWLAVGFGLPMSAGPYQFVASAPEQCSFAGCGAGYRTSRTWTVAVWGHFEPNVEIRIKNGVALRLYGGYSMIVNARGDRCESSLPNGCPSALGEHKTYGGFAVGYAF